MSMEAYSKAVFFMLARWHSMTVDVRMGTTCLGNLEMLRATRTSMRAAVVWSLMAMSDLTSVYECSSISARVSSDGGFVLSASSCLTVLNSLSWATR